MADLLTTRQVQDLLQVDRTTIYRMVEAGQLPALRVGKQWRFPRAEVERWLRGQASGGSGLLEPAGQTPASQPEPTGDLASLLPLTCVQLVQDTFADVLGVMLVITDMQGLCVTRVSHPCGLFLAAHHDAEGAARCAHTYQQLAASVALEPRFVSSELGLLCTRGLIRVGHELKGLLVAGGIAPDVWPPEPAQLAALAQDLGLEPAALAAHIDEVYRLDRADRDQVLRFVQRIADILSHIAEDRGVLYGRLQAIASLTAF